MARNKWHRDGGFFLKHADVNDEALPKQPLQNIQSWSEVQKTHNNWNWYVTTKIVGVLLYLRKKQCWSKPRWTKLTTRPPCGLRLYKNKILEVKWQIYESLVLQRMTRLEVIYSILLESTLSFHHMDMEHTHFDHVICWVGTWQYLQMHHDENVGLSHLAKGEWTKSWGFSKKVFKGPPSEASLCRWMCDLTESMLLASHKLGTLKPCSRIEHGTWMTHQPCNLSEWD